MDSIIVLNVGQFGRAQRPMALFKVILPEALFKYFMRLVAFTVLFDGLF